MRDQDRSRFASVWKSAWELHGKNATVGMIDIAFKALAEFSIDDVEHALSAHIRDPEKGQFPPKPADVIAQLRPVGSDGYLSADEMWAITPRSEAQTVVWTQEAAEAHAVASALLDEGDHTGARMAFRSTYERLVAESRAQGKRAKWFPSLGHDPRGREPVLMQAVERGLLGRAHVAGLLPPPDNVHEDELRLEHKPAPLRLVEDKRTPEQRQKNRETLDDLKRLLADA